MAATVLTAQATPSYGAGLNVTMAAPDAVNGNAFANTGYEQLVVENTSGSPVNCTITLPASPNNGNGNFASTQVVSVLAGTSGQELFVIGPFKPRTYNDANGRVNFSFATATGIKVGLVQFIPPANL